MFLFLDMTKCLNSYLSKSNFGDMVCDSYSVGEATF